MRSLLWRYTKRLARQHKRVTLTLCLALLLCLLFGVHTVVAHIKKPDVTAATSKTASVSNTRSTSTPASSTTLPSSPSSLSQIITTWAGQQSFSSTVVVKQLTGGNQSVSYKGGTSMVSASTFKIYVAYAILHGIEQGKYSMSTVTDDGNSIQTDLDNMILNSDNDAARTLGFLYGWDEIDDLLESQGITSTTLNNYIPPSTTPVGDKHTTASDLTNTLIKLYNGQLLNRSNTQLLLGLMEQQNYRDAIPSGVPSSVTVADKPGWLTPADGIDEYVENDAAIIYGPKGTYVLTIMTTGSSTQALANLSKLVYTQLGQ